MADDADADAAIDTNESLSLVPVMPTPDHPPYAEMICDAITSLREEGGSKEASVAKYIESTYLHLPPAHAHTNLLTYHLAKLTKLGEILQPLPGFYTLTTPHYHQNPNPSPTRPLRGPPPKLLQAKRSPSHLMPYPDPGALEIDGDPPSRGRGRGRGRRRSRSPKTEHGAHENDGPAPIRRRGRPLKALMSGSSPINGGDELIPEPSAKGFGEMRSQRVWRDADRDGRACGRSCPS